MVSGSGAAAAVSVFEDRFKPNMEVRLIFIYFILFIFFIKSVVVVCLLF